VRELGFLLFDGGNGTLPQAGMVENTGSCVLWGSRLHGPTCRVAGYHFLLLSVGAQSLLQAVVVGSTGLLCTTGRQASWHPQSSRLLLSREARVPALKNRSGDSPSGRHHLEAGLLALCTEYQITAQWRTCFPIL
jgi:hypothetical protein